MELLVGLLFVMPIIGIFWIGFALALAVAAECRFNREGLSWFVLAIIISPLLALCFLLAVGRSNQTSQRKMVQRFALIGLLLFFWFLPQLGGVPPQHNAKSITYSPPTHSKVDAYGCFQDHPYDFGTMKCRTN
jgi:hypothetical protein